MTQPEKEEGKDNLDSNRSNYDDDYQSSNREGYSNREEIESGRDHMQSARSNKTEGGMNLHDLVVEMYEELNCIVGALPNLENMRVKIHEMVESFIQINESLKGYKGELKEILTEEIEKMRKEYVNLKKNLGLYRNIICLIL